MVKQNLDLQQDDGRNARHAQMVQWTVALVLTTTVLSFGFLLKRPDFHSPEKDETVASVSTSPANNPAEAKRSIASEVAIRNNEQKSEINAGTRMNSVEDSLSSEEIKLQCNSENAINIKSKLNQIRLSGSYCRSVNSPSRPESSIENKTSGFVATLFPLGPRHFTTDLIPLTPGMNSILIRHSWADGKAEQLEVNIEFNPSP